MLSKSGQDAEALGKLAQLGPRPWSGELDQVAGDCSRDAVRAGLLRSEPFGFFQAAQGFADLPPHGVRLGQIDVVPGLPFGWQPFGLDVAGVAYGSGVADLDWYQGGEYVIIDEAGTPVHPEWYSDEFRRLLRRAGLRKITLHDSRHMTLTLMEHAGVPISIISKWAGHYDSAFTQKTYVHASGEDLQRGQAALARIHKIA
jgi:hypothetical protein